MAVVNMSSDVSVSERAKELEEMSGSQLKQLCIQLGLSFSMRTFFYPFPSFHHVVCNPSNKIINKAGPSQIRLAKLPNLRQRAPMMLLLLPKLGILEPPLVPPAKSLLSTRLIVVPSMLLIGLIACWGRLPTNRDVPRWR